MNQPVGLERAALELAEEVVRSFGSVRFRATGFSMLPAIRPGDILEVRRRGMDQVVPGEIVLLPCYGRLVAHRVVACHGGGPVTQGDALPAADPPINAENLLGVVVSIERDGRSFAPALRRGRVSRFTAGVLRRSDSALRLWLKIHSLRVYFLRAGSLRAGQLKVAPGLTEPS